MAKAYMAEHPNVTVEVAQMPESPSSEAGIQTAIAGGTAPAASENINISFGQQLASTTALVPLDTMSGWDELIASRHMEETIKGWQFPDGHYYVLPQYSNAMLWGWRIDILREIGYDKPPRTYSEIYDVGKKLKAKYPDKFILSGGGLTNNTWWYRFFDFFMLYDAASNGVQLASGTQITADDAAAEGVLSFYAELKRRKLMVIDEVSDPFETGVVVANTIGPWAFSGWAEKYPELKFGENYVLAPPPVPDSYPADQPIKTFADAKGISFYRQASPEATAEMWKFVTWALSRENNDLEWLVTTNLPPARDDLSTNPIFQQYFAKRPELLAYASALPNGVPPMASAKLVEIQTALGDTALIPVVLSDADPAQSWAAFREKLKGLLP